MSFLPLSMGANTLWKLRVILAIKMTVRYGHPSGWPFHFIVGFDLEKENAMSETLRDACRASLDAAGKTYHYYSLAALAKTYPALEKLPYSLKVLLENLFRNEDGGSVTKADIEALAIGLTMARRAKLLSPVADPFARFYRCASCC